MKLPCGETISANVFKTSVEIQYKIQKDLEKTPFINLTIDIWTSKGKDAYLGVIGTYLVPNTKSNTPYNDAYNMSMTSRLISIAPLMNPGSHSSDSMKESIEFLLHSIYNTNISKVFAIIGDNVAFNVLLANKMKVNYFGCLSHKINLAIKDIIEEVDEINDLKNNKINLVISYFRQSDIAKHNANITKSIQTYSKTRWYSFFASLKSILDNKDKINLYFRKYQEVEIQKYNILDSQDFYLIELVLPIIKVFNEVIGEMSGGRASISVALPVYRRGKLKIEEYLATLDEAEKEYCSPLLVRVFGN